MSDVDVQEIEVRIRQFKEEFDSAAQIQQQANKLKQIADNTGSIIISLMEKNKLKSHKTVYGTAKFEGGELSLNNHSAKTTKKK